MPQWLNGAGASYRRPTPVTGGGMQAVAPHLAGASQVIAQLPGVVVDAVADSLLHAQAVVDTVADAGANAAAHTSVLADSVVDVLGNSAAQAQALALDAVSDLGATGAVQAQLLAAEGLVEVLVQQQGAAQAVAEAVADQLSNAAVAAPTVADSSLDQLLLQVGQAQQLADAVAEQLGTAGVHAPTLGDTLLDALAAGHVNAPGVAEALLDGLTNLCVVTVALADVLAEALATAQQHAPTLATDRLVELLGQAAAHAQGLQDTVAEGLAVSGTHTQNIFDFAPGGVDQLLVAGTNVVQLSDVLTEALLVVQVHQLALADLVVVPAPPALPGGPLYGPRVPLWQPSLPPQRGYGTHVHNQHAHAWLLRDSVHGVPAAMLDEIMARYGTVQHGGAGVHAQHTVALHDSVGGYRWDDLLLLAVAAVASRAGQ